MSWSIRLLKVKGIDIKVHLTFVLILAWAAYRWSLGTDQGIQGALFGIAATLLLFTAVTLHELGHSFQAQKFGIKVKNITLMPMGGLAQLEDIPENPKQELRIALAGPLVNFAIAGVLVMIGVLLQTRAVISFAELSSSFGRVSWSGMLAYLTMANLLLGVFNLIPAFPMDGGRVLRALLAMRMDHARATRIASVVGQGLAWLLGLWGFMTGAWTLVLIAVFVWLAAGQEGQQSQVKKALRGIKVGQVMSLRPHTLSVHDRLAQAVELTLSTPQVDFPVVNTGTGLVEGLLTENDLLKWLHAEGATLPVGRAMHTRFPTASPEEPLWEAQKRMANYKAKATPVLDAAGGLVGLLTASDINEAYRLLSAAQTDLVLNARSEAARP